MSAPLASNSFWGRRWYYLTHRRSIRASDEHTLFAHVSWPAKGGEPPPRSPGNLALPDAWNSLLRETRTRSFQVYRGGELVRQWLAEDSELRRAGRLYSVTKSVLSLAYGAAIANGWVPQPESTLGEAFSWARGPLAKLTVEQLFDMDSGIAFDEGFRFFNLQVRTYLHPRSRSVCRSARVRDEIGENFHYNDVHSLLIGWILEDALRGRGWEPTAAIEGPKSLVASWIYESVLLPIGVCDAGGIVVDSRNSAFAKTESGLFLSVSDAAKVGRLFLNGGVWEGERVVPEAWIRSCTQIDRGWSKPSDFKRYRTTSWGDWLSSGRAFYRNHWWGIRDGERAVASFAMGIHGQIVLVSPKHDAVVVRLADRWALKDWWPERILSLLDELEEFSPR